MLKALRFFGWPLLVGVLVSLLIMQQYPQLVGLPMHDVQLRQAPIYTCLLYTSPSPRDQRGSRMPSSA